jgi:phospholipid N-methyltransferase
MFSWVAKFLKSPREIGAIAPSSPHLARLMASDIPPDAQVLELGPGTGVVTEHILSRLSSPGQLTLIERDADLSAMCAAGFPGVAVRTGDAEPLMLDNNETYDVIVSGIPFAAMDQAKRARLFRLIAERLRPGGRFIMFQYSTTTLDELKSLFGSVDVRFTPLNLPPAFVFVCRRERKDKDERQ